MENFDSKTNIISMKNVGVRYGNNPEVLSDVNLNINKGDFYFLTGASGSGKTSLLKLIYLDLNAIRGEVSILGHKVDKLNRESLANVRKRIGVVFQDYMLLNHLSVYDNVALPLRILGKSESYIKKHVVEMLNWIDMGQHIWSKPYVLSGGQQQRVAIARAVIHNPEILIADEPTGSVDDAIAYRLLYLFKELNKRGTTVILSSHNQALIKKFGFPVINLSDGGLVQNA